MNLKLFAGSVVAAAGLLVAGFAMEPVKAQGTGTGFTGLRIGVLNVRKVFDDYPKFKSLREEFQREVQAKEDELRQIQQAMVAKQEMAAKLTAPADQEKMAKEMNDLKFQMAAKQRKYQGELAKREADIYATVYKDMAGLLATYCKSEKIHVVLRLDEPSEKQPEDSALMAQLSKQVVYHHPNLDLTEVVSEMLKTHQAAPAVAAEPKAAPTDR